VPDDDDYADVEAMPEDMRVATVFPGLTRKFFDECGKRVIVVPVSGAVEVTPHLGIADAVVDITSTGSTLKTNGLREVGTILESSARLIAPNNGAVISPALEELTTALASVVRARGKRYLMANVPRDSLGPVRDILPGLNGPTVIDILDGGKMVAVHAVVAADLIYRTIRSLKQLGAKGILVTRIERLMP
jgi:ATP phosphoribosyltransferase